MTNTQDATRVSNVAIAGATGRMGLALLEAAASTEGVALGAAGWALPLKETTLSSLKRTVKRLLSSARPPRAFAK